MVNYKWLVVNDKWLIDDYKLGSIGLGIFIPVKRGSPFFEKIEKGIGFSQMIMYKNLAKAERHINIFLQLPIHRNKLYLEAIDGENMNGICIDENKLGSIGLGAIYAVRREPIL